MDYRYECSDTRRCGLRISQAHTLLTVERKATPSFDRSLAKLPADKVSSRAIRLGLLRTSKFVFEAEDAHHAPEKTIPLAAARVFLELHALAS